MGLQNVEIFEKYLHKINNEQLQGIIIQILKDVDDANGFRASSSSGKYHPKEDNEEFGNATHCKKVTYILLHIAKTMPEYDSPMKQDMLLCSGILHDMCKYKNMTSKYTEFLHPQIMADKIRSFKEGNENIENMLEKIAYNIETHMSRWNVNKFNKNEKLKLPKTKEQYMLCFADMIAADKNIFVNKEVIF